MVVRDRSNVGSANVGSSTFDMSLTTPPFDLSSNVQRIHVIFDLSSKTSGNGVWCGRKNEDRSDVRVLDTGAVSIRKDALSADPRYISRLTCP